MDASDSDPLSDPEERRVLLAALDSFREFRRVAHLNVTHRRRQAFLALPSAHVDLLSQPPFCLPRTFDAVDRAIDCNADICDAIVAAGLPSFGLVDDDDSLKHHAKPHDLDKARSTVRQLYRDWSAEGLPERHAAFSPILRALDSSFASIPAAKRHRCRVLVPGAGLGRLVFDLCAAGYTVEGNEISYHQLLASNYILNCVHAAEQHRLYPWALSFSNNATRANQLRAVAVPDVHPAAALAAADAARASQVPFSERMSMSAGDFCVLYRRAEYADSFDAVATCFFVDTAPNLITYIDTIRRCLKPGGLWANLGPLLWHFESAPTPAEREKERPASAAGAPSVQHTDRTGDHQGIGEPGSFELSHDEVMALVERLGFEVVEQKQSPAGATGYIQDPDSMLQSVYRPMFWLARKR